MGNGQFSWAMVILRGQWSKVVSEGGVALAQQSGAFCFAKGKRSVPNAPCAYQKMCSDVVGFFGRVGVGRENGWTRLFTLRTAEP